MSTSNFPRQDVQLIEKTPAWFREHLTFAEGVLKNNNSQRTKYSSLFGSFNGKTNPESIKYLTDTYGKKNRSLYVDYRAFRPKLLMLQGEWLERPMRAVVRTINQASQSEKTEKYHMLLGAASLKPDIEEIRQAGVDPLNGMEIPDEANVRNEAWRDANFKDKKEILMQLMLNKLIPSLDLKGKYSESILHVEIVSGCFSRQYLDPITKKPAFDNVDLRDAIYVEIPGDTFIQKSPIKGACKKMTVHDVLRSFDFTEGERKQIEAIRNNAREYAYGTSYNNRYNMVNGNLTIDVIHIEWKGLEAEYYKISPPTNAQLARDPEMKPFEKLLNAKEYETNKARYDSDVAAGRYTIETLWREVPMEATLVGHDIVKNARKVEGAMINEDDPTYIIDTTYSGFLFGTVDGERISLQETINAFSKIFNVTMYQLLRELNKAKGKVFIYDRAGQPRNKTVKEVMYDALNDSFIEVDSSGAGNRSGKDIDVTKMIKELDLGVSSAFPMLIQLKNDLVNEVERITGINNERMGQIQASATVANTQSNLQGSRAVTESMFFGFDRYVENTLMKMCEIQKISWCYYQQDEGRVILGDEKYGFMEADKAILYANWGVYLVDGTKELQIRRDMKEYALTTLNTKELRYIDALDADLAETLAESREILKKGWETVESIRQKSQAQAQQAAAEMNDKKLQMDLQIATEDREDRQGHEKELMAMKLGSDQNRDVVKGHQKIKQEEVKKKSSPGMFGLQ